MKVKTLFVTLIIAFAAGYTGARFATPVAVVGTVAEEESVYDRVMRTGTLRCGYGTEKPYTYKNPATGNMEGIFYEYVEKMATNLSLEVEWVEEMGWGEFPAALAANRIDAFCTTTWKNAGRARVADFITPILHEPIFIAARKGDTRFNGDDAKLNSSSVKFVAVEGQLEAEIIRNVFPKAKLLELPQVSDFSQALLNVTTGKADAILVAGAIFSKFVQNNPNKLVPIEGISPLRVMSEGITVKRGEYKLRHMFDVATYELLESGAIEQIVKSYNLPKNTFYIAKPSYKEGV